MIPTENQLKRLSQDWMIITKGESIEVDYIKGNYYAYGSELATLRLFHHYSGNYQGNKKVAAKYSENLKTWYFCLEGGI